MSSGKQSISFYAGVLMTLNTILGAGIYVAPQKITALVGAISFLGWGMIAIILFPLVATLACASRMFPGEGGFYRYGKEGMCEAVGFTATWIYVVGYLGSVSTIIIALRELLVAQTGMNVFAEYALAFNIITVVIFCLLNLLDIELIAKIQSIATLAKIAPLLFVIGCMFVFPRMPLSVSPSALPDLLPTIPLIIFAFLGIETCCGIAHLIEGGSRQAARAIYLAFVFSVVVYTLFHLGLLFVMGAENLALYGPTGFVQFLNMSPALGSLFQYFILFSIFFSMGNTLYGIMLSNITNLHALVKQQALPFSSLLGRVNDAGRPVGIIAFHGLLILSLVQLIPTVSLLMAFVGIGVCSALFFVMISVVYATFKRAAYKDFVVGCLGTLSALILLYYSWASLGTTFAQRAGYVSVVYGTGLLGLIGFMIARRNRVISK